MSNSERNIVWYGKWFFASYAAALALYLLVAVVSLPFLGYELLMVLASPNAPLYLLGLMLLTGPIVFKKLK